MTLGRTINHYLLLQDYDLYMKPCTGPSETIKLCDAVNEKFGSGSCEGHTLRYAGSGCEAGHCYCVAWSECRKGEDSTDLAMIEVH